ncbi:MAG: endonuclease III [Oscillospiraceae bacterium]|jgi:endonuclease-3|nr:endonuclease III [Oscillospiraceae bacterium]
MRVEPSVVDAIVERLKAEYPDAVCSLDYGEPYQLLISVRLAAQCTDARVNMVTPALFARYPSIDAFANADQSELEEHIHSCGFFRAKARDIILAAQMLLRDYGGVLPDSMDELLKLPGVGRKTANLILGDVFGQPAYVVDTHCIRLSRRMGLTQETEPAKIETDLRAILPPAESSNFCHRLVLHGRAVCTARRAMCERCCVLGVCARVGV